MDLLFQNSKSTSSCEEEELLVLDLQDEEGLLVFGGLICSDKSGCAGNNSISFSKKNEKEKTPPHTQNSSSCVLIPFGFVEYFSQDVEIC